MVAFVAAALVTQPIAVAQAFTTMPARRQLDAGGWVDQLIRAEQLLVYLKSFRSEFLAALQLMEQSQAAVSRNGSIGAAAFVGSQQLVTASLSARHFCSFSATPCSTGATGFSALRRFHQPSEL